MKLIKKTKDCVLPIYLIINVIYLLISSYLSFMVGKITMKQFSLGYAVFLVINVLIILLILLLKKYRLKKTDIFLILICIFAFVSYLFAYKKHVALFGCFHRNEGLLVILYYMTTVFLSSYVKEKYKKTIIYFILLTGFIEFVFSVFQKLDLFNVHTEYGHNERFANGFTNNPNFFATLMLLCLALMIGLYFDDKKKSILKKIFYCAFVCFYMIGLLFSNTTSCIMGLIFILVYLFIYSKKNKEYKKYICIISIIVVVTIIISVLGLTNQIQDLIVALGQMANISVGHIRREYGTSRIHVWIFTLKRVPKYLWTGIGIDNFKYINNGKPVPYWLVYDKCHNEYLQILITMGIFSLISYLSLYFVIVKNSLKNSLKNKELYLILPIIGYLVQAFFNISVIEVAPLFYILLGLNIDRYNVN